MSERTAAWAMRLGYWLLRALGATWRVRWKDHAGVASGGSRTSPVIWLIWHNRLIVIPTFWRRWFTHRRGGVLVSRSKDGTIIAGIVERMGGFPVRGSSSRGGASALAELSRMIAQNYDAYITPDGPRGPCYSVSPGALWLAQATGAPIMPVSIEASRCWRLKSWDRFIIPKPFASVEVTLHPPLAVAKVETEDQMAAEQLRLQEAMLQVTRLR